MLTHPCSDALRVVGAALPGPGLEVGVERRAQALVVDVAGASAAAGNAGAGHGITRSSGNARVDYRQIISLDVRGCHILHATMQRE